MSVLILYKGNAWIEERRALSVWDSEPLKSKVHCLNSHYCVTYTSYDFNGELSR